jgi:hypothetical protein
MVIKFIFTFFISNYCACFLKIDSKRENKKEIDLKLLLEFDMNYKFGPSYGCYLNIIIQFILLNYYSLIYY